MEFPLPGVQLMQQAVNRLPVRAVRQCLFHQPPEPAQVAFEATQLNPRLLMFQTWDGKTQGTPFC